MAATLSKITDDTTIQLPDGTKIDIRIKHRGYVISIDEARIWQKLTPDSALLQWGKITEKSTRLKKDDFKKAKIRKQLADLEIYTTNGEIVFIRKQLPSIFIPYQKRNLAR